MSKTKVASKSTQDMTQNWAKHRKQNTSYFLKSTILKQYVDGLKKYDKSKKSLIILLP